MIRMSHRVEPFGTTIFSEINSRARQHNAVNLGQGAPDFDGPPEVLAAAVAALHNNANQYAPGLGYLAVRQAIADHARRFYGQIVDPETEVAVTAGATEAMLAAVLGLLDSGDEAILFQPAFDSYSPQMQMAGVNIRYVTLNGPDWTFDPAALAAAFTDKTRAILLNTPNNPTGKAFSRAELEIIADLCRRHDVIALTDEVYEHLMYDRVEHVRLATLPGMADRTLTISSMGKTFSVTGWKIGWVIGPAALVSGVIRAHQFNTYSVASPLQLAAATALALPDTYYAQLTADFQARRDLVQSALQRVGFETWQPNGGYFVVARWKNVAPTTIATDMQFTEWLIKDVGVACIPVSCFYQPEDRADHTDWVRFSVCKTDATLNAAIERLERLTVTAPR